MDSKVIYWMDTGFTDARGWLVFDSLRNGVATGGIFMHEHASLKEVADLAKTMTLKNSFQAPLVGGAKGGIRYDHTAKIAPEVLKRFIIANKDYIYKYWGTGADLNTDNREIHAIIQQATGLPHGFISVASMLCEKYGYPDNTATFLDDIHAPLQGRFDLHEVASGYSTAVCIEKLCRQDTTVIIQGFGRVGRAVAYYIEKEKLGKVVGIIEKDCFVYSDDDSVAMSLMPFGDDTSSLKKAAEKLGFHFVTRARLSDEDFLLKCLATRQASLFCPCANRYIITEKIARTLIETTFAPYQNPWLIAGANNVFANDHALSILLKQVNILPEWVSNCGNALLYNEILKLAPTVTDKASAIYSIIYQRLHEFLNQCDDYSSTTGANLYEACIAQALTRLNKDDTKNVYRNSL